MHVKKLTQLKNVIGYSEKEDKWNNEEIVTVFVKEKIPLAHLDTRDVIPFDVRTGIGKYKLTDVVEIGEVTTQANRKTYRPIKAGCEIGRIGTNEVGTAGAVVKYPSWNGFDFIGKGSSFVKLLENVGLPVTWKRALITNAHVAQHDVTTGEISHDITQPGLRSDTFSIGKVMYTKKINPDADNELDVSIVDVADDIVVLDEIIRIGKVKGVTNPSKGDKVKKYGRTTLYTEGEVIGSHTRMSISGFPGVSTSVSFRDLLMFSRMSTGGDSGSIIVNEDGEAVALLFAGSKTVTFGIPIEKVLKETGVTFA